MNVLIDGLSAKDGGGITYLENLLQASGEIKDLNIVAYLNPRIKAKPKKNLKIFRLNYISNNWLLRLFWEIFFLPIAAEKHKADIIFFPGGIIPPMIFKKALRVTMFRNMMPFDEGTISKLDFGYQKIRNKILKPIMLHSLFKADLVLFISNFGKFTISNYGHVKNSKIISHGIDPIFLNFSTNYIWPKKLIKKEYLLYVSKFEVYKNQDQIIHAYALLPKLIQEKYNLVLVGDDTLSYAKISKKLVKNYNLEKNIIFYGAEKRENLPMLYSNATIVLFGSTCENCPNILLEAMGVGKPIISSNAMPMPEFGADAIEYFTIYDVKSIKTKIEKLLKSPRLRAKKAYKAKCRAKKFNWTVTSKKTWKEIRDIYISKNMNKI